MEALILVAESGDPTMMARIGIMKPLNRNVERIFDPERKGHHWGKRKLKRERIIKMGPTLCRRMHQLTRYLRSRAEAFVCR
jgi:hypothetical protein